MELSFLVYIAERDKSSVNHHWITHIGKSRYLLKEISNFLSSHFAIEAINACNVCDNCFRNDGLHETSSCLEWVSFMTNDLPIKQF